MESETIIRRALRGKGPILLTAIAAVVVFAVPAAAQTEPPTADMAVVSIAASRHVAAHGTQVTFTEVIRNNGPEAIEMDTLPQITGGTLVAEVCDLGHLARHAELRVRHGVARDEPDDEVRGQGDGDARHAHRQGRRRVRERLPGRQPVQPVPLRVGQDRVARTVPMSSRAGAGQRTKTVRGGVVR